MSSPPRISANDLARYLVSKPTTQISIVKNAKSPQKPPIIRYTDARKAIVDHLSDMHRSKSPLVAASQMLEQRAQDPSQSSLRQDDATKSIEVIGALQDMSNQLAGFQFHKAAAKQAKLMIEGVEVSVHADMLVHGERKGIAEVGAAMLRMTQDDAATDAAKLKRQNMGLYVATLLRMHTEANLKGNRTPANRLCLSIDVQHGEAFVAPKASAQRMKDIRSACKFIAALWDTV
ncbi:hypothetical protein KZZ07_16540 [Mameliella sp. CS4]|uniref:hypothetical protein n=1 Tax=Mameliella sp. CS4 TaxID=2862329 RepID=UPI001C5F4DD8|nr:hypothetical protein [Mameliella sp. CS4]MBW4984153.1 hypothetical protein [Mameliella sp. CS4]